VKTGLVEFYETGIPSKIMAYVAVEPENRKILERLSDIKQATATYHKGTRVVGYHWLLHPITVGKLKTDKEIIAVPVE